MSLFRSPNKEPLWKDEFSVFTSDERYVTRRQFTKFLTLASLGMFVGNLWILLKSRFAKTPAFPTIEVAELNEIPVRGVKLFTYPTPQDHCIMIRTSEEEYVAYSQKCTHLSCAVYYSAKERPARMSVPSRLFLGERRFGFARSAAASPSADHSRTRRHQARRDCSEGNLTWPTSNLQNRDADS